MLSPLFALIALLLLLPASASPLQLPDMGDTTTSLISPQEETAIGRSIMGQLRRANRLLEDPLLNQYISQLGHRLASHHDQLPQPMTFFLVDDDSINAFAMPGGYIGIHSVLITASSSEAEVAAVVAHEIAHVTQRHLLRGYEKASRMNLPLTTAVIAAILLGGQNPQVAEAALASLIAGSQQYQLDFTRDHEHEADRIGIQLLARAGFDPTSMATFFGRLDREGRYYNQTVPEFLRTHPITTERLAEAKSRAEQFATPRLQADSLEYRLVRAALMSRRGNPVDRIAEWQSRLQSSPQLVEYHYGLALAYLYNGDYGAAATIADRLLAQDRGRIAWLLLRATLWQQQDEWQHAEDLLQEGVDRHPGNRPLTLALATTLLRNKRVIAARDLLNRHLINYPDDAEGFRLLAEAEAARQRPQAAMAARAEYLLLRDERAAAIELLRSALRQADEGDFYLRARLESRLQELDPAYKPPSRHHP
jgi:beta-barrel assembly-enhancing protease